MKKTTIIPIPVQKTLTTLGTNIKEARIKRRLTMKLVAERAGIKTDTLSNVEKGSPTVSIGIYAKVLFVLGLVDNMYELANPDKDEVGKILASENLPKRVRYKNKKAEI
ncbi:MAG: helix-turn-helix transcriptional regulator [bacterium]